MKHTKLRTLTTVLVPFAFAAVLAGCDNEPAEGKAKASVAAPVEEAVAPKAADSTDVVKYTINQDNSQLEFVGAKVTDKHEGKFEKFSGAVELVGKDPTKSKVTLEVNTASLAIEPEKLSGHLKSADFFDVEKFPTAKFTSTAIKSGGEGNATHTVTGNLTLHGVTKSISFPATIDVSGDSVSAKAEFAINRKDFGIVYPGMPDDLIKDDVLIKLSLNPKKS